MSRFLATIYDRLMADSERACLAMWRDALLVEAAGDILEIGAGTGANVDRYGSRASTITLTEPDPHMRARLVKRFPGASVTDAACEHLPFEDARFDTAVSTLVLCSVRDPARSVRELRRVLRPGGKLLFIEHVAAAPGTRRRRWQGRVEPLWRRVLGNCHLTRETERTIERAGFRIEQLERESIRKTLPVARPSIRGVATRR